MRTAFVYLIGPKAGPIKIGHAANVKTRLHSLQIGNWEPISILHSVTVPLFTAAAAEAALHKRFADYRVRGEWFSAPLEMLKAALENIAHEAQDADAANDTFHENACVRLTQDPRATWDVLSAYRETANNLLAKGYIEGVNAALMKEAGQVPYAVFLAVVVHRRDIARSVYDKPHLARQAERSLVIALDALVNIWRRTHQQRLGVDVSRRFVA
ncbi:MAG: GIY-YIG nuclease family protein [Alphaproteobacteria bacterium]|nr:MAG: GIY-YIG nuclease family protein [Alphaproteobacteria bacterium]